MATVYKRTRRKPIPKGAAIIERMRKPTPEELQKDPSLKAVPQKYAVWSDGKTGRPRRAPLSADGTRIELEDRFYTVEWFDWEGKRHRKGTRSPDKDAAQQLANRLETAAMQRREGLIDVDQERFAQESRRPLSEHLADYEAKLRTAGRDERYVADTLAMVRAVLRDCSLTKAGAITADAVNRFAAGLKERGLSARRVHAHLTAVKGFTRWLTMQGKLAADPLVSIKKPSPKSDRRHERRILLHEEWEWLYSVTWSEGRDWRGIPAAERVALYGTAIQTGLRQGELRSLTRGRLFLDGAQPCVTCKAGSTKNRKDARQYIQPDLAAHLRALVATKAPAAPVFAMPDRQHVAAMLREDLAAARREWLKAAQNDPKERLRREQSDFLAVVNHEGEALDFHALRHTCGAWLATAGSSPKAVQTVMRHSSITLTMDTYGHLFPGEEAATIARLPQMFADPQAALRATGTGGPGDGAATTGPTNGQQKGQHTNGGGWQNVLVSGENWRKATPDGDAPELISSQRDTSRNDKGRRVLATPGQRVADGTRTHNSQIHSQSAA